jgi:hypothetical protein
VNGIVCLIWQSVVAGIIRLRDLRNRWRAGTVTRAEVEAKVRAWIAHAENADTWRLRRAVFVRGWFRVSLRSGATGSRGTGKTPL